MSNIENKKALVSIPEASLLDLVASKLKHVVLFPEKLESAKAFLAKAKIKTV